jgi:MFS transporter, SP family, sugar:H+ symporter
MTDRPGAEVATVLPRPDTDEQVNLPFIALIVGVATLGGFLFGYDSGVINGTIDGLEQAFGSTAVGMGFNVASLLLGCAAGAFVAGRLADRMGRRGVLLITAVLFVVSAFGTGYVGTSTVFVVFRFIGGLAVGAASVLAPAYVSEVAPARIRGRLASIQQIMIIVGITGAFLANYLLAGAAGGSTEIFWLGFETWRWMFWAELAPASLFLVALLFIPESPRYLVLRGREAAAGQVLTRLFGDDTARRKVREIQESLAADHQPRLSDLLDRGTGRVRKIVWVGIGLATFQQLVGINVVFYYGAVLWQAVGFSEAHALLINVMSGSLSLFACLAAIALIDKIGRKPLLLAGSIGMAISLGVVLASFYTGSLTPEGGLQLSPAAGRVALVSANVYVVFFNFSWGPVMWVMLGEMFPNQIRGSGLAVSGFAQWMSNFGISWSFPVMLATIGLTGAYGFYTVCAALSILFVLRMVHETRGRELEEMPG